MKMRCEHKKLREVRTHGDKSRGYLVCKYCKKIIRRYEINKKRQDEKRGNRKNKRT